MLMDSTESRTADVIVIGGGIIGCSIALRLARVGLRVSLFDRGEPGDEASSAAGGMIAPQGEKMGPDEFFQLGLASHRLYPEFVAEVEELSRGHVGFRQEASVLVALDEAQARELVEIEQSQKRLGLPAERWTPEDVHRHVPGLSPEIRQGLLMPQDHWVDNELLTRAVILACRKQGVSFFPQTAVRKIHVHKGRAQAVTAGGEFGTTFSAAQFVLAAGCWSGELAEYTGARIQVTPCRGQMLEFEAPEELPCVVRAGHTYLVPRSSRRVVMGSTVEHVGFEKAVTGDGALSILQGAARVAPVVKDFRFRRAWAGLRPDTADHLPVLGYGEVPNLVFATGHFRNGILLAPITAQAIADLVLNGSTPVPLDSYRPDRFAYQPKVAHP